MSLGEPLKTGPKRAADITPNCTLVTCLHGRSDSFLDPPLTYTDALPGGNKLHLDLHPILAQEAQKN